MKTELETQVVKKLAISFSLGAVLWMALKVVWNVAEGTLLEVFRGGMPSVEVLSDTEPLLQSMNVLGAFLGMAFVSFWLCWGVVRAMVLCATAPVSPDMRRQRTRAALRKAALFSLMLGGIGAAVRLAQFAGVLLARLIFYSGGTTVQQLSFSLPFSLLLQAVLWGGVYLLYRVPFLLLTPERLRENLSESLRCTTTGDYARAFWKAARMPCVVWVVTLLLPVVSSYFLSFLMENPAMGWVEVVLYQGLLPVLALLLLSVTGSLPRAILRLGRLY